MSLSYRIALQSLRMNRVRTSLTTLGIIIGVASVTLILTLGSGIEKSVRGQVSNLNDNVILVTSGAENSIVENIDRYNPYNINATTSLTEQDLNTIRINSDVEHSAPLMILKGSVSGRLTDKANVPIVATTPELATILDLKTKPGQFVDNSTTRDTAVIGWSLSNILFGNNQVLGQELTIKGRAHTAIGALKQMSSPINLSGVDLDNAVFISFDDGKSFNQGVAQIQQILVTVKDSSKIDTIRGDIEQALLKNHNDEHDFMVLAGQNVAEHGNTSFSAIVLMTAIVATVTLVVGGIGIMNIMLVGVSERTREIGVRKALGATNSHIFSQFLIEALLMCAVGGITGLVTGYGLAIAVAIQLSFQPVLSWQIAVTGLGMAFVTGIVFGTYPAVMASKKDPIESLRQYN